MIGFILGRLFANANEWFFHKYVLHDMARKKGSFFSYHWVEHHKEARKNNFHDKNYNRSLLEWNPQSKEAASLLVIGLLYMPFFLIAPTFTAGFIYSGFDYYAKHKKAHLDPEWAKKYLPWHWDHHMGKNQEANWCITAPWFDYVMNTRIPYLMLEKNKEKNLSVAKAPSQVTSSRQR